MSYSVAVVWDESLLGYTMGGDHPLHPVRLDLTMRLADSLGVLASDRLRVITPTPAGVDLLTLVHDPAYLDAVRRAPSDPSVGHGLGTADNPIFEGMYDAAALITGGSVLAARQVHEGTAQHAVNISGGLHHAMRGAASGFCVFNDAAVAIACLLAQGYERIAYVDLDVHHGDGVEAIHAADPGVLTVSFHESGRYLFPGTGFADEVGEGPAAGTVVNVPLPPDTGDGAWLAAVTSLVPELAAEFRPDIVVSQHGADSHLWDPLAHLRNTVTAMGAAARLVHDLAHEHASGRWLATGGGGYDVYRVVPRSWSLVWLAAAHREVPAETPEAWRDRWATEAQRYGQAPLPLTFDDPPTATEPATERAIERTVETVRSTVVPLLRTAVARG
jgi:acetoin utilization protein AcuC